MRAANERSPGHACVAGVAGQIDNGVEMPMAQFTKIYYKHEFVLNMLERCEMRSTFGIDFGRSRSSLRAIRQGIAVARLVPIHQLTSHSYLAVMLRTLANALRSGCALGPWPGAAWTQAAEHAFSNPWLQRPAAADAQQRRSGLHTSAATAHGHSSDEEGPRET